MELFLKQLTKKDLVMIFQKYKDNDQASLWPFLEKVDQEKSKLLTEEMRTYFQHEKEELQKWYEDKTKTTKD